MATTTPTPPLSPPLSLNLCAVLSESKRIINAHSRHFLALSVLFLLPLSFSTTVLPTIHSLLLLSHHLPNNSQSFLLLPSAAAADFDDVVSTPTLILSLAYSLLLLLFSLLAVASITFSVFHGFFGRPVKLLSAVRSVLSSFLPLLASSLLLALLFSLVTSIFALLLFLAVSATRLLGFPLDYSSPYFLAPAVALAALLAATLLYLQLNWTLVPVIAVVESDWGFSAMRRSAGLIQGMRAIALSLLLFLGLSAAALASCSSFSAASLSGGDFEGWRGWEFALQIVITSAFLTVVLLYSVAANTVLYMYCKAVHGELATEIAEEFATEYVCLPFDDGKVPHVVSVAYA